MNLRDLKYAVALAETRHFGKAAALCRVSQPTLSGQIRKLEDFLGVSLFERTNKWVEPTDVGLQILRHAAQALEASEALTTLAKAARDPLDGMVRLGIIPTLAPYLLPLALGPIAKAAPKLDLEIWEDFTEVIMARLTNRQLDMAIIATDPPDDGFSSITLFDDPFLAAFAPGHPLAKAKSIDARALGPDLLVLHDGHCLGEQVSNACGQGAQAGRDLRAAGLETLIQLVAAGYGTTLIPAIAARAVANQGIVLRPIKTPQHRTVRLVMRTTYPRRQAGEVIATTIRGLPGFVGVYGLG